MSHPSARTLLDRYGLAAKKSWGQNFLADPHVPPRIAAACGLGAEDTVLEIGAGLGHLTAALLETGARVVAVERDRDMARVLRGELGDHPRFELHEQAVQDFDLAALAARTGGPYWVAGNLPYHLSSQILVGLLDARASLRGFVVMVQREVAERIAAPPGGRDYGVLSVLLQAHARVRRVMDVPPGAFLPPPKVVSTVLRFDVLPEPVAPIADEACFRRVVHAAFGQRRKTLRNALSHGLADWLARPARPCVAAETAARAEGGAGRLTSGATDTVESAPPQRPGPTALVEAALATASLDPGARAETLGVAEFARLTEALLALDGAASP